MTSSTRSVGLAVSGLTTERRVDPTGIDAVQPRFAWRLTGDGPAARQSAFELHVFLDSEDDPGLGWSTRAESGQSTEVPYGGPPLQSRASYSWRVRVWDAAGEQSPWSTPATFEMGLLSGSDWTGRWIAHLVPDQVSDPDQLGGHRASPALRKHFTLPSAPRRARLYITALGLYEAYINGAKVGDERLAPGWTNYTERIQYQTFDVTGLLRQGDNVIAARLGDGWYAGMVGDWGRHRYGDVPALLCQLECQLQSGELVVVVSDPSWTAHDTGTWLHDLQSGERTDYRREPPNWTAAEFDDRAWDAVTLRAAPGGRLVAARDEGVRVVDVRPAISVNARSGAYIVDVGANVAGVVRLQTVGRAGERIVVRHGEALDAEGGLYTENLRTAQQQDEYVLADNSEVVLEPRFTVHGFRYAEISGLDRILEVDARVLSSATRLVGSFSCSDPLVNQLQKNILTSLRANFISIPTDCPQRNERLGWTADLQVFAPTAVFNADLTNTIEKWLDDLVDSQLPSGAYPDVAPAPRSSVGWGNSGWADAGVLVPWTLYQRCGDLAVLERMYVSMRRYMAFLEADQTDDYRFAGRYGDWVSLGAPTDKDLIGTAYLAHVAEVFARIAGVLDKAENEEHWRLFAGQVRHAFVRRFVAADGRLSADTQTAYALALGFELLPEEGRQVAADRLAELVEGAGWHLATWFLGTPLVLPALSDNGHHELACRLLRQDRYPSWLYEVKQGATSIWERWNGWRPETGFYSPQMNSFNHYAFGAVGDWMYRYLAGLQPVEPGYRRTELRPRPGAGLTAASATHESLFGRHHCSWSIEGGTLHVSVGVPANTEATLLLPDEMPVELPPGQHTFDVQA